MDIKIENQKGITIISLTGNLDSVSSGEVQNTVLDKITTEGEGAKFVFDMQSCDFVSSAGLRTLLIIAKRIKVNNSSAAMGELSEEIMEVMEMTGFDEMYDSYPTVDAAISSLV